ncbi:MAG: hypothetical protein LQ340_000201 [Diploschistes diacapsis]|nr:MAG: hypothetical protein LQ340_000201 [Diploschistes diacapsis]
MDEESEAILRHFELPKELIPQSDLPIKGQEIDFLDLHSCRRQIEERKGYKDFFRGVVEGFYYYISVV